MSIPLHLVTGFLGSGKTTFLSHFLKHFGTTSKVAVVQNEFAPVNMDGAVLKTTENYHVLEINNGSAFCVCLLGSFMHSLHKFVGDHRPDVIVMEASGLSDTLGVGQVFQSGKLKGVVYLEHIWCLVDALHYKRAIKQRFEHQVRSADTLVVNKTDLLTGSPETLIASLKKINPYAGVFVTAHGKIDFKGINKKPKFFTIAGKGMGRPNVQSVVIKGNRKISKEKLQEFLKKYAVNCYRYKGFVQAKDPTSFMVQGVFNDFTLKEIPPYNGPTELVLIGEMETEENVQMAFQHYCQ